MKQSKSNLIENIIHTQKTYLDNSALVLDLKAKLEKMSLATLSQLSTIINIAVAESYIAAAESYNRGISVANYRFSRAKVS